MTGHPDYRALLAVVRGGPDDDTPRLVLADWLEEHGQGERAEFVRVQVELAKRTVCTDGMCGAHCSVCDNCRETDALRRREAELLADAGSALLEDFPPPAMLRVGTAFLSRVGRGAGRCCEIFPRRGFVEAVECEARYWLAHGDTVLAAQPVRRVRLTDRPELEQLTIGAAPGGPETDSYRLAGRRVTVPRDAPSAGVFAARWPGVVFEVPPEPYEFTLAYLYRPFSLADLQRSHALVNRVNDRSLRGLPAGSCLYLGCSGQQVEGGAWRVEHRFAVGDWSRPESAYPAADLSPLFVGGTEEQPPT